jgi:hypothetical protein
MHSVRVNTLDIDEARQYLACVRSLADEGVRSSEPKVLLLALRVLARQPAEIQRLLIKLA